MEKIDPPRKFRKLDPQLIYRVLFYIFIKTLVLFQNISGWMLLTHAFFLIRFRIYCFGNCNIGNPCCSDSHHITYCQVQVIFIYNLTQIQCLITFELRYFEHNIRIMRDTLLDLVPFVQFKKHDIKPCKVSHITKHEKWLLCQPLCPQLGKKRLTKKKFDTTPCSNPWKYNKQNWMDFQQIY